MPETAKLIDAWVTLGELYPSCIDGTLVDRRFDTPSAVSHAKCVIEQELESRMGREAHAVLWDAYDKRNAEAHA